MKTRYQWLLLIVLAGLAGLTRAGDADDRAAIARGWVEAAHAGKAQFAAYVEKHMADDGAWSPDRYVGLGFYLDPQNDEQVVVAGVIPGTPASKVLREGDVFVSVAGVPATDDNRERLNFRGKPGEPVPAVIKRDGKEMPIEIRRGVIDRKSSKADVLENVAFGDADEWPVDEGRIVEVLGDGRVVYVVDEFTETEQDTGITYVNRTVTRFEFNDDNQITGGWNMDEDRFVLEQLGYTISR